MVTVYDFEILKNFFLGCYKERAKPSDFDFLNDNNIEKYLKFLNESIWYDFEVSQYRNDLPLMIDFLKSGKIIGQIGYNCMRFDSQIQQYIIKNASYLLSLSALEFCEIIHHYANDIIDRANNRKFLDFPEWKLDIEQCDPFLINHYDNQAKSTSLKWLQFSMNWPNIIEMNVDHNVGINSEQEAIDLRKYCHNDVLSTEVFYWITKGETNHPEYKGKDQIALRKDVSAMINKSCINWNDVKIGEQLNFINYSKATGKDKNELYEDKRQAYKGKIHLYRCVPSYISFKTKLLQDVLSEINNTIIDVKNPSFKKAISINYSTHTMALGGIHSTESFRRVVVGSDEVCIDADVSGQYPSAIIRRGLFPCHLSLIWNEQIKRNVLKRAELKPLAKTDKKAASWSEAYKLANNGGGYGKLGEITNWQYDLECMYSVTIGCQLEILMLIEELELNSISVISSNTDGIVSLMKKDKEELYYKICKEWEEKTNSIVFGKLEFANYKEIISMSVNDYMAIKTDNTVKYKGDFIYDPLLHKNKSRRIVPMTLKAYYVDKIEPENFIRSHRNIYDFCCAVRADSTMTLQILRGGEYEKQQKTVRYYIANTRNILVKLMKPLPNKVVTNQIDIFGKVDIGTRENEVEAGYKVQVFNEFIHKDNFDDYNINYDYYINKVRSKINDMELLRYIPTVIV